MTVNIHLYQPIHDRPSVKMRVCLKGCKVNYKGFLNFSAFLLHYNMADSVHRALKAQRGGGEGLGFSRR